MATADVLVELFNNTFLDDCVRIEPGAKEPIYYPRDEVYAYDRICFTRDYFASALHEVAHWCIAGSFRRTLIDYGYWYRPAGRNSQEQQAFYSVEVKPQALEWIFSVAAGCQFWVSVDNFTSSDSGLDHFTREFQVAVTLQVRKYLYQGLPKRAARFAEVLAGHFQTGNAWSRADHYELQQLTRFRRT